jgi:hypothetical protein
MYLSVCNQSFPFSFFLKAIYFLKGHFVYGENTGKEQSFSWMKLSRLKRYLRESNSYSDFSKTILEGSSASIKESNTKRINYRLSVLAGYVHFE